MPYRQTYVGGSSVEGLPKLRRRFTLTTRRAAAHVDHADGGRLFVFHVLGGRGLVRGHSESRTAEGDLCFVGSLVLEGWSAPAPP